MKRSRLKRGGPLRPKKNAVRKELTELARRAMMLREGATWIVTQRANGDQGGYWYGECWICGLPKQLYSCHIYAKGQFRSVEHDTANLFPGCWRCHDVKWHGAEDGAKDKVIERLGGRRYALLGLRARASRSLPDARLVKLALLAEIARLESGTRYTPTEETA